jgi:murein L,D-transpeptidase YafK
VLKLTYEHLEHQKNFRGLRPWTAEKGGMGRGREERVGDGKAGEGRYKKGRGGEREERARKGR